jgi:hypothetical protein
VSISPLIAPTKDELLNEIEELVEMIKQKDQ